MSEIKVIIVPSSDDEIAFEGFTSYEEAEELHNKGKHSTSVRTFETIEERDAYLKGYKDAIGYLGEGFYFTNTL